MENKLITIQNVRGYEKEGIVYLNAEDVARGLGFTETKKDRVATNGDNYSSVRWNRVNGYLQEFGYTHEVGKDDYIPENMFYRLAMKAKNETAEKFQAKVADEILPAIRKTGMYSKQNLTMAQMFFMAAQTMVEHEQQLFKHEQQINEIKKQINSPFTGVSFQQQLQSMQIENHDKRLKGIEQQLTSRDYSWPDKNEARTLNNRIYNTAMCYKSLANEEKIQNLDDSFFISRIQQRLIADFKEQGRDILAELKEAQTYYYAKYMDAKLLSKTIPDYILRPAEIKKLSLPKYLSTDTELIRAANLFLTSYAEQATEV